MATINYTVNAIDAASGVFKRIAASADGLDTQLSDLSKRVATPAVDLNDAKFTVGVINAAKRLDKLNAMVANPEVEVDTAKAQTEILRINAMLDRLGKKKTTVEVDVKTGVLSSLGRGFGGGIKALIPGGAGGGLGGLASLIGGGGASGASGIATSIGGIGATATGAATGVAALAAALAAAAFAAQALAGGIVFSLGSALAGMAILGASKAKSVKDSFKDLAAQANKELITIGKPFIPVLNSLVSTTRQIMRVMTPVFADASKIIAGPFKIFADSLIRSFGQPAVKESITAVAKAFGDLLKAVSPTIPGIVAGIAKGITAIADVVAKNPKAFAVFAVMLGDIIAFGLQAIAWLGKVAIYIEQHFGPALQDIAKTFDQVRHDTASVWGKIYNDTIGVVIRLGHNAETQFNSMRHGIANVFDGIRHDIADAFHFIATVFDQFRTFQGQTGAFEKDIAFVWDHIHAMTVQTWDAIRHYLASVLDAMRSSIATEFDNIRHDIAAAWDAIWKTSQTQTKNGIDGVVKFFLGMPGRILHALEGLGTDLYNFGKMIWTKFWNGMQSVVPNILGWIGHFVASVWDKVKKFFGLGSPSKLFYEAGMNLMIGLENGIKDHAHRAANAAASASKGVRALPGGGAPAANAALARKMMPAWSSGAEWNAWNAVAMAESGWNQFARNPSSGAYGIPQALPPSKMGAAANPPQSNPGAQIAWMISYIKSTYGDPLGAAAHENAYHWYGSGLRDGIFTSPTLIGVGDRPGGERVNITPANQDGGQRVVLEVRAGNSSAYSKFLVDELQKYIRVAGGGDVQVALGG